MTCVMSSGKGRDGEADRKDVRALDRSLSDLNKVLLADRGHHGRVAGAGRGLKRISRTA